MIQRIQTVYLFFVLCLMAILAFVPFSSLWAISVGAGIIAALALITIFLYKKRKIQIKICYLILFLLVLLYALYFIFDKHLPFLDLIRLTRYTFVFPFIAGVLVFLAIRGIIKDEKLVRSLDRLR